MNWLAKIVADPKVKAESVFPQWVCIQASNHDQAISMGHNIAKKMGGTLDCVDDVHDPVSQNPKTGLGGKA